MKLRNTRHVEDGRFAAAL